MFSYRHGFHAGNHADVLKHMVLIAVLKHLTAKPTALTVVDTHAGAGLYRLDDDFAGTSGESLDGIVKLLASPLAAEPPGLVADYLDMVKRFNPSGRTKIYPGSPFVTQALLRQEARDKLRLFELHPTDSKALATHVDQLEAGRQVTLLREDGFEGLRALLPPPSRRALVLIDPSYEIKNDYGRVAACIQESLKKFATGTYMVWYPVIP
ncbi:MAG TPA: 23S rRNA (adenine(2030)-N(6))-methyltransferase RlmJ, partial [Ramlibacter sp.]|nr:23S rRNA (adenine(2030)-N(6))-methyltransferase RlmJ [Ramlibacter sp.]